MPALRLRWPAAGALCALAALLALGGALLAASGRAGAHANYERSVPADGAVIRLAPARVDAWFTQEMFKRQGANTLIVTGPDGEPADGGETLLDDADRTHLSIDLRPSLPPGEYVVAWTTLSAVDGDPADGIFAFTVDPLAPSPTPTAALAVAGAGSGEPGEPAARSATRGADGSLFPWWFAVAAGAIALSGGLGAWALIAPDPASPASRGQ